MMEMISLFLKKKRVTDFKIDHGLQHMKVTSLNTLIKFLALYNFPVNLY